MVAIRYFPILLIITKFRITLTSILGSYIDTERFIFDTPEVVARHYPLKNASIAGSFSRQLSEKIRQLHNMLTERDWGIYRLKAQISMALGEGYDDNDIELIRYYYSSSNTQFFDIVITPKNIHQIIYKAKKGKWAPNVLSLMENPQVGDDDSNTNFLYFTDFKLTADLLYK